jgi:hypothetical protein
MRWKAPMTEGWSDDDSRAFIACGTVFGGYEPAL